jgi:phosphoribosylformylglycinamidine synthase
MKAKVYITLKKGVLDPQGKAVMGALGALDFKEVKDVRVGKFMELEVEGPSKAEVGARVEAMCEKLLANTVIEDYRVEIE